MRLFKMALYILLILVLQMAVFARLNIFDVTPDLFLVSIIGCAILESREWTLFFAAAASLLQGIFAPAIYLNIVSKTSTGFLVNFLKENFAFNDFMLMLGFVFVFTPLALLLEWGYFAVMEGKQFDIICLMVTVLVSSLYNLFLVPLLFPIIKKLCHD